MYWPDFSTINVGSILYCKFPYDKVTLEPEDECHYVMVVDKIDDPDNPILEVCYGTSQADEVYDGEMLIDKSTTIYFWKTGLIKKTKFDFSNRAKLIYSDKHFVLNGNPKFKTPLVGHIDFSVDKKLLERFKEIIAELKL